MSVNLEMKISPKFNTSHFTESIKDTPNWNTLVEIFSDRLDGRYLRPIQLILDGDSEISEFSGFSIMALDCILIETLNQFYSGKDNTDDRTCEKSAIEKAFVMFLTSSEHFKTHFNTTTAKTFYFHFRNGLLHQAQTKNNSLIKIEQSTMVTVLDGGLIIDREKFHDAIKSEIECYKKKLLEGDVNLRSRFIKKMKYICNIPHA